MDPLVFECPACGQMRQVTDRRAGDLQPAAISAQIHRNNPLWKPGQAVCRFCIGEAKAAILQDMLQEERDTLTSLDRSVLDSLRKDALLATLPEEAEQVGTLTGYQRLALKIADLASSSRLPFLVLFFLAIWVGANLLLRPFDPFPVIIFAVISAVLASLAALEAPLILVSQRLQGDRDRMRSQNDYRLNLKAELEIRYLDQKTDLILQQQKEILAEIEALKRAPGG